MMRGIYSSVTDIRRKVFTEVARLAYEGGDYSRIEELPYKIVPGEKASYRESIFLERAIVGERLRLAMGLPLRPVSEHAPLTKGVEESAIAEKYYDPPLVNIIKFACNSCPEKLIFVTNGCQGCLAHPCKEVCPKGAISMVHGKSFIDQEKCIKCGRCVDVCPMELQPLEIYKYGQLGDAEKLLTLNIMDCFSCKCCEYICSSKIPLVSKINAAKGLVMPLLKKK